MANGGSCDFRQLERLQRKLEKLNKDKARFCEQCTKELAARFLSRVIRRTPVGKYPKGSGVKGGTLRRGWTAGKSQSAFAQSLRVYRSGDRYSVVIINPVQYAPYVEYGHRTSNHAGWVAGRFMMTISEQEVERLAPALLEKRLMEFLNEALND